MKEIPFENSSFPVLGIDDNTDKIKGIGTCTLTRLDDNRLFLLNAAHTIQNWGKRPIYIALPNGITIELPFALKTKSKTIDKIDIAVTPLLGDFATHFYGDKISSLPLYDDFPDDQFKSFSSRIIFFGYPSSCSRSSIDEVRGDIKSKSCCITSVEVKSVTDKTANYYDIDFNLHILAKFELRKMKNQKGETVRAPNPHGISGGPVFNAFVKVGERIDNLKIVNFIGIGNEYLQNRSLLKATRKSAILGFVNTSFSVK